MSKRRVAWAGAGLLLAASAFLLIPGSPFYIPQMIDDRGHHEGHSSRYWIAQLESPYADQRLAAVRSVGAIGAKADRGVPQLMTILQNDQDPQVRLEASLALTKMGPATKDILPQLIDALHDPEPLIRMNVVRVLLRLRADARPAVPALIACINDGANHTNLAMFTFTIQELALITLGHASHGTQEGLATIQNFLTPTTPMELRLAAIRALGHVGPEARTSVLDLQRLLKDTNQDIAEAAHDALEKITGQSVASLPAVPLPPQRALLELPEDERIYLWDIEHQGNVLVKHGFAPLAQALKNNKPSELAALLASDFHATRSRAPAQTAVQRPFATITRDVEAGPTVTMTASDFSAWLLQHRQAYQTAPQVKCALMTLSPEIRGQTTGRWHGMAQLRLAGETAPGQPAETVITWRYTIAPPTEERLAQGHWLQAAQIVQVTSAKAPHALFTEVAQQRGLKTADLHDNWTASKLHITPGGIYVCDYDHDGYLDILVTDVNGPTLYHGLPAGQFEDATAAMRLPRFVHGLPTACWGDFDGDGWEDLLYCGRLFRNDQGKKFIDVTRESTLRLPADANGYSVADYDHDGLLDIYVTRTGKPGSNSWLDSASGDLRGNFLMRNKGNWQFADVTLTSNAGAGRRSTFAAAWLDVDNDGWPDLHVPNEFGNGVLLINQRNGTFREQLLAQAPVDFGTMGLTVGDINNDGNIDLYCANMYSKAGTRVIGNMRPDTYKPEVMAQLRRFVAGSQLHLNRGALKFDHVGKQMNVAAVGWAYGATLADLDNDGWLDLYATAGYISRDRDKPDG